MPNWKKIALSGSSPEFSSLNVDNSVSAGSLNVDTSVKANSFTGSLLRLDENGTGLRMTNIGAFDNSSGDFRIFANQDLIISTNGDSGTAVTIDQTTKDANFVGAVTASAYKGDGSGLTNVNANVAEVATVSDTFTSTTSKVVNHLFGTKDVIITVYNNSDQQIIPASITTTDTNNVTVTFDDLTTGRIVVAKGGHIVSGSASDSSKLNGQSGSYYLDYANATNTRFEAEITGSTVYTIVHSLNETLPIVQVYDNTKKQVIPGIISASNANTVILEFDTVFNGTAIVKR